MESVFICNCGCIHRAGKNTARHLLTVAGSDIVQGV